MGESGTFRIIGSNIYFNNNHIYTDTITTDKIEVFTERDIVDSITYANRLYENLSISCDLIVPTFEENPNSENTKKVDQEAWEEMLGA